MTDHPPNIGPPSSRRRIATLIAAIGIVFVASRLANAWPRTVEIAFQVGPEIRELDADYLQEGSAVASVRFGEATHLGGFRHAVRLRPGEYQIHITLHGKDGSAVEELRILAVPTEGLTRFDLRDAVETSE